MWQEKDSVMGGGDIGGDAQYGRAWSRRFVRPDVPGAILDVTVYPILHSDGDTCVPRTCTAGVIELEQQIAYMTVNPSDGEEVWSDYDYSRPLRGKSGDVLQFREVGSAEDAALAAVNQWSAGQITWDGKEFH